MVHLERFYCITPVGCMYASFVYRVCSVQPLLYSIVSWVHLTDNPTVTVDVFVTVVQPLIHYPHSPTLHVRSWCVHSVTAAHSAPSSKWALMFHEHTASAVHCGVINIRSCSVIFRYRNRWSRSAAAVSADITTWNWKLREKARKYAQS